MRQAVIIKTLNTEEGYLCVTSLLSNATINNTNAGKGCLVETETQRSLCGQQPVKQSSVFDTFNGPEANPAVQSFFLLRPHRYEWNVTP